MSDKDGFCRAPRIEMVNENTSFQNASFGELLNKASFECDDNMGMVKSLAKGSSIDE